MEEEIKKRLAEALKGLTGYQIAKDFDMLDAEGKPAASGPTNWIKGVNLPRPSTILKLCKTYNLSYDYIMTGGVQKNDTMVANPDEGYDKGSPELWNKIKDLQIDELNSEISFLASQVKNRDNQIEMLKREIDRLRGSNNDGIPK